MAPQVDTLKVSILVCQLGREYLSPGKRLDGIEERIVGASIVELHPAVPVDAILTPDQSEVYTVPKIHIYT